MNALQIYKFQDNDIRITDINGVEWFIASDIAKAIEHSDTPKMCKMVEDRYTNIVPIPHPQNPEKELSVLAISEPGLWQILAKSRLPKVEPFQVWLYEVVLPSIRKTGSYSIHEEKSIFSFPHPCRYTPRMLRSAADLLEEIERVNGTNKGGTPTIIIPDEFYAQFKPGERIPRKDFYFYYRTWCEEKGVPAFGKILFFAAARAFGRIKEIKSNDSYYVAITVNSEVAE